VLVAVGLPLSLALMTGALGIIVSGVLSADEAYRAVSWKTIFLLAALIPLGQAVERHRHRSLDRIGCRRRDRRRSRRSPCCSSSA
jgi:Na+/H+ antiporter NhaD/arsenite permease-like protein